LKRAGQQPKKRASARAARRPRPARPRPISRALHYQATIESSDDAILSKDLHGVILSWNQGAERLFGFTPEEAVGRPVMIIIPLDRLDEEPAIFEKIHRGERIEHFETVRQRKDGSLVDISLTISPIRNSRGKIVGASKIARDITDLRKARDFDDAAHQPTTLQSLVRTIVAPFDEPEDPRIALSGIDAGVSGAAVTSFALLLHEFATNAAKYGALSSATGTVKVVFREQGDAIVVDWTERGGPLVAMPEGGEGFGAVLSRIAVSNQLGGEIIRDWRPEGLAIRLSVPRSRLEA
jgi:PAS domain S-box-containing protein